MANEITKIDQALQAIKKGGLDSVLKPLLKEIFLTNVFVHGVLLHGELLRGIKVGSKLTLKRSPKPYDNLFVEVYHGKKRIGELSEKDEGIFAHLLDAGKKLSAKAKKIVILPEYAALEISISLVDF